MLNYFIRRIMLMIPTFLGITMLVFAITRFVPGGPMEKALMEIQMSKEGAKLSHTNLQISDEIVEEYKKIYGFDKPWYSAYYEWLIKAVQFDLGTSTRYQEPVFDLIKTRMPISIGFGLTLLILSYSICIPIGILKAIKHKTFLDNSSSIFVFIGYAIPSFVVGIIFLLIFGAFLNWFPIVGLTSDNYDSLTFFEKVKDVLWHSVLPLLTYISGSFAVLTMLMKNTLMDNLAADFVRTSIAKGLDFKKAVYRHAFRNSLIPIATNIGSAIGIVLSGSFLVETVFSIDGMGTLSLTSVNERDYPVTLGILTISCVLFMIGNIISDFAVALVDPRVRFE